MHLHSAARPPAHATELAHCWPLPLGGRPFLRFCFLVSVSCENKSLGLRGRCWEGLLGTAAAGRQLVGGASWGAASCPPAADGRAAAGCACWGQATAGEQLLAAAAAGQLLEQLLGGRHLLVSRRSWQLQRGSCWGAAAGRQLLRDSCWGAVAGDSCGAPAAGGPQLRGMQLLACSCWVAAAAGQVLEAVTQLLVSSCWRQLQQGSCWRQLLAAAGGQSAAGEQLLVAAAAGQLLHAAAGGQAAAGEQLLAAAAAGQLLEAAPGGQAAAREQLLANSCKRQQLQRACARLGRKAHHGHVYCCC